jgi:transcription factor WhiB
MAGERINPDRIKSNIEPLIHTAPTACVSAYDSYYRGPENDPIADYNLQKAIMTVCYLPPDLESMKSVYTHLNQGLARGSLQSRLLALSMSNIMLHQMSLPYGARTIHETATVTDREQFEKASISLFSKYPQSEETRRERQKLSEAASFFRVELYESVGTQHTAVDQLALQVDYVNTLVTDGPIFDFEEVAGNREWNVAFRQIQDRGIATIAANPLTTGLLLAGDLRSTDIAVHGEAFVSALDREMGTPSDGGNYATELATYFFAYKPLQEYFWDAVFDEPTLHRDPVFWFFNQPNDREQQFLSSAFPHREDWRELDKKEKTAVVRKIAGLVAKFKAQYPHERGTYTSLSTSMLALTKERRIQDAVAPIFYILEDEQPGVVYIDPRGEALTITPGDSPETFTKRVEDAGDAVVYRSRAEILQTKPREIEVEDVTDAVEYLTLEGVADFETVFRWPHAHGIRMEDIGTVSTHITNRLHFDPREEEEWFEYVTDMQDSGKSLSGDFPAIFPELFPSGHRLYKLKEAGIKSVEGSDSIVSVVIDPDLALIKTGRPGVVVLQGRIDDGGNFVPLDASPDALGLPLQLVLTGAAQFAMRYSTGNRELTEDELAEVQAAVTGFNGEHKYHTEFPVLVSPKMITAHQDNTRNQSVLVHTGKKGEFIPVLLDFISKMPEQSGYMSATTEVKAESIIARVSEQSSLTMQQINEFVATLDPAMQVKVYILTQYFMENLVAKSERRLGSKLESDVMDDTMHEVFRLTVNGTSFLILLQHALTEAFKKGDYQAPAPASKVQSAPAEQEVHVSADLETIDIGVDLTLPTEEPQTSHPVIGSQDTSLAVAGATNEAATRRIAIAHAVSELKSLMAQGNKPDYLALCKSGHEELAGRIQRLIGFGSALTSMLADNDGRKAADTRSSHQEYSDSPDQSVVRTIVTFPGQFKDLGKCRGSDPDELFVQGAAQNQAKLICRGCDVRGLCLAYAVDTGTEFGVWGGTTERERRALVRRVVQKDGDTNTVVEELRQENIAYLREKYL